MKFIRVPIFIFICIGIGLLLTQKIWVSPLVSWILNAQPNTDIPFSAPLAVGYKNATYIINGQSVALLDGKAESESAPGSAAKIVTRYFGNAAKGDLNGDNVPDIAFLLTQESGGSGTSYYVVAALKTSSGYQGTNGILLGDRIAPQTTEIKNRQLVVNYAERQANEPMTTQPSVGMSTYLEVSGTTLIETNASSNSSAPRTLSLQQGGIAEIRDKSLYFTLQSLSSSVATIQVTPVGCWNSFPSDTTLQNVCMIAVMPIPPQTLSIGQKYHAANCDITLLQISKGTAIFSVQTPPTTH